MRWFNVVAVVMLAGRAMAFDCTAQPDGTLAEYITGQDIFPPQCLSGLVSYVGQNAVPGTGTVAASGTTVTGTGTIFVTELNEGNTIIINNYYRRVTVVTSDTSLQVDQAYGVAISAGTAFTYMVPIIRRDDPDLNYTKLMIDGAGRVGIGSETHFWLDLEPPPVPAVSTGNGATPPISWYLAGEQGQSTTDATGKHAGNGAKSQAFAGTGGQAPAGSTPGTGGRIDYIGGKGGNISSGTGGTGAAGGIASLQGGAGGDVPASNTNGTGGDVLVQGGLPGTGGTGGAAGKTKLGQALLVFPDADGTANKCIKTDGSGTLGWSAVALPTADGSAHKPVETNGSGQLQFSADAMPAADGTSGQYVTTNGSGQLGFTTLPTPAVKSVTRLTTTSDVSIASVTEVQVLSGSVTTTTGNTVSITGDIKLINSASGSRNYTATIKRGGTACSDATTVTDGDQYANGVASGARITYPGFTATEAAQNGATTYRLCVLSSSATGTQTFEFGVLTFTEF